VEFILHSIASCVSQAVMQRCASITVEVLDDSNIYSSFLLYQPAFALYLGLFLLEMFKDVGLYRSCNADKENIHIHGEERTRLPLWNVFR
jgi:hypothetical protein